MCELRPARTRGTPGKLAPSSHNDDDDDDDDDVDVEEDEELFVAAETCKLLMYHLMFE